MTPFIILLLTPIIIQHTQINRISYKQKNEIALVSFFVLLTILVMLRHESIGNDTDVYLRYFNMYSKTDWSVLRNVNIEFGYSVFNKLISLFVSSPQLFLAITAIIPSVMIYPTYKRLCMDSSLTIVIFCTLSTFVMMFSGIRQVFAIGIGFIAYHFTRNKKIIPFVLCVLLAMAFHVSAFMLLFMYPLYHARITKKWLLVIGPVLTFIFLFNETIFSFLGRILERYTNYDATIEHTGAYTMLFLFAIFTIFAFLIPEESRLDSETIGLRNFLLMALVVQMYAPLHMTASRMNYYYIIFLPLLLPKIIACRSIRWNKVAVFSRHVMVVFFLLYFFVYAYRGGGLHVFPYHFFWENI